MRSILTGFMKRHMTLETDVDGKRVHTQDIDDPFLTTSTRVGWNLWDWFKMLFKSPREIVVRTRVHGDGVAHKRWFAGVDACEQCESVIGFPHDGSSADDPGYHHGDKRLCGPCYYGTSHPLPLVARSSSSDESSK